MSTNFAAEVRRGLAVWDRPPPSIPQILPASRFRLVVHGDNGEVDGLRATCAGRDDLLQLSDQLERLGYRFMRLERMDPERPTREGHAMSDTPKIPPDTVDEEAEGPEVERAKETIEMPQQKEGEPLHGAADEAPPGGPPVQPTTPPDQQYRPPGTIPPAGDQQPVQPQAPEQPTTPSRTGNPPRR